MGITGLGSSIPLRGAFFPSKGFSLSLFQCLLTCLLGRLARSSTSSRTHARLAGLSSMYGLFCAQDVWSVSIIWYVWAFFKKRVVKDLAAAIV